MQTDSNTESPYFLAVPMSNTVPKSRILIVPLDPIGANITASLQFVAYRRKVLAGAEVRQKCGSVTQTSTAASWIRSAGAVFLCYTGAK